MRSMLWLLLLGGCVLSGCANTQLASSPGYYEDTQLREHTYAIKFAAQMMKPDEEMMAGWRKRAVELCGGDDFYYKMTQTGRNVDLINKQYVGVAYCNTRFIDARQQVPDETFLPVTQLDAKEFEYKEPSTLYPLLLDKRFADLEAEIAIRLGQDTKRDELFKEFGAFARINTVSDSLYEEWVRRYPSSAMAHYAYSINLTALAWHYRGHTYWNEVSEENKQKFTSYTSQSLQQIDKALALKQFPEFYAEKIGLQLTRGKQDVDKTYVEAVALFPHSFVVRSAYVRRLLPRWGGSLPALEAYAQECAYLAKQHPELERIWGLYQIELGDQQMGQKKPEKALEFYQQAVAQGDIAFAYHQMGVAQRALGRNVDALSSFAKASKLDPYSGSVYEELMVTYLNMGMPVEALKATVYLTALDNQNPAYYDVQGDIFYSVRRYDDAIIAYQKASVLSGIDEPSYKHKIRKAQYQIDVRKNQSSQPGAAKLSI